MPRFPRVVHIGVVGQLPGGMAQVVNEYLSWQFAGLAVCAVASTTGRGDPWAPLRSARCLLVLLAMRISRRPHAVVLHLSSGGSFIREGGLLAAARLLRLPAAVHLHGSDFAEFAHRRPGLVGAVLRLAHRVYVLTDETRAIACNTLGAGWNERVVKVANGVATPDTLPDKERVVLFAGEVGVRKGVDVLLEAWAAVHARHPDWHLVIAGPDTDGLADDGSEQPSVTMPGSVDRDEVHRWQARAAIAVLPSRQEALPMFLLESMAHGCAVVATPVGDVEDLLDGCGVVVPVGDADELAAVLERLVGDPATVACMGEAARKRIAERYSEAAVVTLLEREWTELLAAGR